MANDSKEVSAFRVRLEAWQTGMHTLKDRCIVADKADLDEVLCICDDMIRRITTLENQLKSGRAFLSALKFLNEEPDLYGK